MEYKKPTIILLAAGESTRMGVWKHGEPFLGTTLIQYTIQKLTSLPYQIIVVGGYQFEKLQKLVTPFPTIKLVYNPHYKSGFVSSVQQGIKELRDEDFFILPGDMPIVPTSIFLQLEQRLIHDGIRPVCEGVPGHPVLFRNSIKQAVSALPKGESLQPLLKNLKIDAIESSIETIQDVDSPSDLLNLNYKK